MTPFVSILLLISCTDDFKSCYSNDTMVKIYPTVLACEQDIIPLTEKFAFYGEQIFSQCTNIRANLNQQEVALTWSITNRGNLLLRSQTIDITRTAPIL
ncbi:hypothetical protein NPX98_02365 [Bartonella sp. A5(2022)]|nr:hypothetical protein [Bartonella sp. A05]MCZ2203731.1 hypothetical protein [Bartonella sp. A05]